MSSIQDKIIRRFGHPEQLKKLTWKGVIFKDILPFVVVMLFMIVMATYGSFRFLEDLHNEAQGKNPKVEIKDHPGFHPSVLHPLNQAKAYPRNWV